jgi:hypothetical protein
MELSGFLFVFYFILLSVAKTEISYAAEWVLASQEGLFSMELGSCYIGFNKNMYLEMFCTLDVVEHWN